MCEKLIGGCVQHSRTTYYAVTPGDPKPWRTKFSYPTWKRSVAYTSQQLLDYASGVKRIAEVDGCVDTFWRFSLIDADWHALHELPVLPGYHGDRTTPKTPTFAWVRYHGQNLPRVLYVILADDSVWYWGASSSPAKWTPSGNLSAEVLIQAANGQAVFDVAEATFVSPVDLLGMGLSTIPTAFANQPVQPVQPAQQPEPEPEQEQTLKFESQYKSPFIMETPEWAKAPFDTSKITDKIFKAGRAHELKGLIGTLDTLVPLLKKQLEELQDATK